MSQWTHFLGVVRFDSMNLNVWPKPPQVEKVALHEVNEIHRLFQSVSEPRGSEGPIDFETVLTNRGPTVVITGDLRDYGYDDLPEVVTWLNEVIFNINSFSNDKGWMIFIRDSFIRCEVESNSDMIAIQYDHDKKEFQLTKYNEIT